MCLQVGVWGCRREAERSVQPGAGHPEEDRTVWCESVPQERIDTQQWTSRISEGSLRHLLTGWCFLSVCCSCCCVLGSFLGQRQRQKRSGSSTKPVPRKVRRSDGSNPTHRHPPAWAEGNISIFINNFFSTELLYLISEKTRFHAWLASVRGFSFCFFFGLLSSHPHLRPRSDESGDSEELSQQRWLRARRQHHISG